MSLRRFESEALSASRVSALRGGADPSNVIVITVENGVAFPSRVPEGHHLIVDDHDIEAMNAPEDAVAERFVYYCEQGELYVVDRCWLTGKGYALYEEGS